MDAQQTDPGRMITCVTQLDPCLLFPGGFPHRSVGKESACNVGDPSLIPGSGRSPGEGIGYPLQYSWASLVAQLVKNPPAMWETSVRSLVGKILWKREWLPTPVFWPGEFHGLYSPWGHKESDTTERLSRSLILCVCFHSCAYTHMYLRFQEEGTCRGGGWHWHFCESWAVERSTNLKKGLEISSKNKLEEVPRKEGSKGPSGKLTPASPPASVSSHLASPTAATLPTDLGFSHT